MFFYTVHECVAYRRWKWRNRLWNALIAVGTILLGHGAYGGAGVALALIALALLYIPQFVASTALPEWPWDRRP